jgi:spore germination cell wall hydrolase CwlJ-like protein
VNTKYIFKYVVGIVLLLTLGFCGTAPVGTNGYTPVPTVHQHQATLDEYRCMYAVILHEAEGESIKGKQAVADVIINRLRHKNYPDSICKVVTQDKQFSYIHRTLRKAPNRLYNASTAKVNSEVATVAYNALNKVLNGSKTSINALYYHANYVRPSWASKKKLVAVVGKHRFYS